MICVELDKPLEAYIQRLVDSGRFDSEHEVLRTAVHLMQEQEARSAALDAAIAEGLADQEAGRTTDAERVFKRLDDKYRAMTAPV